MPFLVAPAKFRAECGAKIPDCVGGCDKSQVLRLVCADSSTTAMDTGAVLITLFIAEFVVGHNRSLHHRPLSFNE